MSKQLKYEIRSPERCVCSVCVQVFVFACSGVRGFVFTCVRELGCVYGVFTVCSQIWFVFTVCLRISGCVYAVFYGLCAENLKSKPERGLRSVYVHVLGCSRVCVYELVCVYAVFTGAYM